MATDNVAARLEYLRTQIRAESISYGELSELQGLADRIESGDVELLEWAGVPEYPEDAPHVGHRSHFTGAWYCDTCDSPYCELA
jgi:hypothetical protein